MSTISPQKFGLGGDKDANAALAEYADVLCFIADAHLISANLYADKPRPEGILDPCGAFVLVKHIADELKGMSFVDMETASSGEHQCFGSGSEPDAGEKVFHQHATDEC
jgi:hypothetical protein